MSIPRYLGSVLLVGREDAAQREDARRNDVLLRLDSARQEIVALEVVMVIRDGGVHRSELPVIQRSVAMPTGGEAHRPLVVSGAVTRNVDEVHHLDPSDVHRLALGKAHRHKVVSGVAVSDLFDDIPNGRSGGILNQKPDGVRSFFASFKDSYIGRFLCKGSAAHFEANYEFFAERLQIGKRSLNAWLVSSRGEKLWMLDDLV